MNEAYKQAVSAALNTFLTEVIEIVTSAVEKRIEEKLSENRLTKSDVENMISYAIDEYDPTDHYRFDDCVKDLIAEEKGIDDDKIRNFILNNLTISFDIE